MTSPLSCDALACQREHWNDVGPSAVAPVTASFEAGSFCGFTGRDGCGKGLLLNVLGLLEPADSGSLFLGGSSVASLAEDELRRARNESFGFLFTHPCLLPSFSVAENVAMPLFRICGGEPRSVRERTMEILDFVGMGEYEGLLTGRLTAEGLQRVALARALVHRPKILVAISPRDEEHILHLAGRAARQMDLCVLWAGKKDAVLSQANRLIEMENGRILSDQTL